MDMRGYAYFVERPRRLKDLQRPHLVERERPYSIVTAVQLPEIDYENFITDMLADRKFIEDYGKRCKAGMYGTACWCSSEAARTVCRCCRSRVVLSHGRRMCLRLDSKTIILPLSSIFKDTEYHKKSYLRE